MIKNKEFLEELQSFYETGNFSNKLGEILLELTKGVASKDCFSGYSYILDMQANAVEKCCVVIAEKKYDLNKSNPHAYFSSITFNSFRDYISKEKKSILNFSSNDEYLEALAN